MLVFLKARFQSRDKVCFCIGSGQLGSPGLWVTPAVPTLRELLIPTVLAHFSFPPSAPCVFIGCAERAAVTFPTKSRSVLSKGKEFKVDYYEFSFICFGRFELLENHALTEYS